LRLGREVVEVGELEERLSREHLLDLILSLADNLKAPHLYCFSFFLSDPTCPVSNMLVTSGPVFFPSFNRETSIDDRFSSNKICEQFPSLLPSHFSFLFLTHSPLKVFDNTFVVQHLLLSQSLSLISSSDPTAPISTSMVLKTMLEAPDTAPANIAASK